MAYRGFSNRSPSSRALRGVVGFCMLMTWLSALIVTGITGYFLRRYTHSGHLIYEIIISTIVLAFWIPAIVLPFLPGYKHYLWLPNFIFSYLWLTSFIFATQDWNRGVCRRNAPFGARCSLKWTSEAFIFLAFLFTFVAAVVDTFGWKIAAVAAAEPVHPEKPTEPTPVATTATPATV